MSVATKKAYKTTFIIDVRLMENPIETLIDELKTIIGSLDGEVESWENLGIRSFSYVKKKELTQGNYLQLLISAPSSFEKNIQNKFRLDKRVHRILVQSA